MKNPDNREALRVKYRFTTNQIHFTYTIFQQAVRSGIPFVFQEFEKFLSVEDRNMEITRPLHAFKAYAALPSEGWREFYIALMQTWDTTTDVLPAHTKDHIRTRK